jgi:hypothetical protein
MWVKLPTPEWPCSSCFGCFFASAMNSFTERAGSAGCTVSTLTTRAMGLTPVKSRSASYGSLV